MNEPGGGPKESHPSSNELIPVPQLAGNPPFDEQHGLNNAAGVVATGNVFYPTTFQNPSFVTPPGYLENLPQPYNMFSEEAGQSGNVLGSSSYRVMNMQKSDRRLKGSNSLPATPKANVSAPNPYNTQHPPPMLVPHGVLPQGPLMVDPYQLHQGSHGLSQQQPFPFHVYATTSEPGSSLASTPFETPAASPAGTPIGSPSVSNLIGHFTFPGFPNAPLAPVDDPFLPSLPQALAAHGPGSGTLSSRTSYASFPTSRPPPPGSQTEFHSLPIGLSPSPGSQFSSTSTCVPGGLSRVGSQQPPVNIFNSSSTRSQLMYPYSAPHSPLMSLLVPAMPAASGVIVDKPGPDPTLSISPIGALSRGTKGIVLPRAVPKAPVPVPVPVPVPLVLPQSAIEKAGTRTGNFQLAPGAERSSMEDIGDSGTALATRTKKKPGRRRIELDFELISKYFKYPASEAAAKLGVCTTVMKRICRKNGVMRWPHRKLKCLMRLRQTPTASNNFFDQEGAESAGPAQTTEEAAQSEEEDRDEDHEDDEEESDDSSLHSYD